MCKVKVMCASYQTRRHPWSVTKWVRYSAMLWYEICFVRYFRSNLVDIKWCDSDNRFLEFWCHLAGLFLQTTCILVSLIKNFLRCLRANMFRFLHAIYWYRCKTICSSVDHKQLLVSVALWLQYLSCVVARSKMRQHIAYYGSSIAVSVLLCVYHVKDNQGFIHQFSCRARRCGLAQRSENETERMPRTWLTIKLYCDRWNFVFNGNAPLDTASRRH